MRFLKIFREKGLSLRRREEEKEGKGGEERSLEKNTFKNKINMENQHFFMVYLQGERTPAYRHATLDGAELEAKRLSKQYGKKAFVLCSLKSFEIVEFKVEDCRPDIDGLPF